MSLFFSVDTDHMQPPCFSGINYSLFDCNLRPDVITYSVRSKSHKQGQVLCGREPQEVCGPSQFTLSEV
jgi:hypothetical protein